MKGGTGGSTINVTGGSITGKITTATANKTNLSFDPGSGSSFTTGGQIGADSASGYLATTTISSGTVNVGHSLYTNQIRLNGGTTALSTNVTMASNTAQGLYLNGGTLDVGAYTLTGQGTTVNGGGFYQAASSTVKFTIGASSNGKIDFSSANVNNTINTGTLTITPTVSGYTVQNGDKFLVLNAHGSSTTTNSGTISVTNTSARITWTATVASGAVTDAYNVSSIGAGDIYVTASVTSLGSVSGVSSSASTVVSGPSNYSGSDAGMLSLQTALNNLGSADAINAAAKKLAPSVTGANTKAAMGALNRVLGAVGGRVDSVRLAQSGGTGVATGEAMKGLDVWVQGFAGTAMQGRRKETDGYRSDSSGAAFGADVQVLDAARVGLALSYANTRVDETGGSTGSGTRVNSYGGTLYGSYEGSPWYVGAALGYTRHLYKASRIVQFTGYSAVANGDWAANQYVAKIDGGYPFVLPTNTVLTPIASLTYSRLNQNGYTETGGGGSNLTNPDSHTNSLRSGLGAKVAQPITLDEGKLTPEFRLQWMREFMDTKAASTTSSYAAGGSSFTSTGAKPIRDAANIGMGLTFLTKGDVSVAGNYDAEIRPDYVGHTGKLEVRLSY
ncbi:hypothetical protein WV31_04975 [Magnetospirillum sp. ME-1]|uniref:autotransporter family protein n=1 Tax=Magnetospirillum sp. ME-1 TaxID=1639348 RepID=UPI000A17F8BF|nr:autotransporter outer membrane beta-barrel domain-containing protein [Magnetospirillum sp. ME-1]ARJ65059.1 hypothetical protein WV31_04975 [Magnetospirillum sp. ME-1]